MWASCARKAVEIKIMVIIIKQCKIKKATEPSSTGRQAPTIDSERVAFGAKQGLEGASTGIAQHKGEAGGGQRTGWDRTGQDRAGREEGKENGTGQGRTGQAAWLGCSAGRQRWALLPQPCWHGAFACVTWREAAHTRHTWCCDVGYRRLITPLYRSRTELCGTKQLLPRGACQWRPLCLHLKAFFAKSR